MLAKLNIKNFKKSKVQNLGIAYYYVIENQTNFRLNDFHNFSQYYKQTFEHNPLVKYFRSFQNIGTKTNQIQKPYFS